MSGRTISHDPFARFELHSERDYTGGRACLWCGNVKRTPSGRAYLFVYWVEHDSDLRARRHEISGRYCSVDCMRAVHS